MNELDLSGAWKAIEARPGANDFALPDHDDSTWQSIDVPSHWAQGAAIGRGATSVFHRKRFDLPVQSGQRSWLRFAGVFTHGSVWVDGAYAGDIDSYFAPHTFEVTNALNARTEHVVAVELNASTFDPPWATPGGIWQPVTIRQSGAVRIARMKVVCNEARDERAVLSCYVELDAIESVDVQVQTLVTPSVSTSHSGTDHHMTHKLAAGANRLHWSVTIDQPDLWWPWTLGNQAFFNVSIEVVDTRAPHQISDQAAVRTGLRQVSFDKGFTFVNGERLFLKSIESGNDGTLPLDTDAAYFTDLIGKRRDLGANLIVRSQWIEPRTFYDVADELGVLIWQGMPSNNEKVPHARHARQMVEVLGHHPSIAVWLRPMKRLREKRFASNALKRTLEQSDASRATIEHPTGWDLNSLSERDVLAIVPKWAKRSRFLYFTSDAREAASHIEALRLLKYRPLGGFIAPLALPELLDGACYDIRLVAVPKEALTAGEEASIEIFVINDTRTALPAALVRAEAQGQNRRWTGDVAADSVGYIGTICIIPEAGVPVTLKLSLDDGPTRTVVFRVGPDK